MSEFDKLLICRPLYSNYYYDTTGMGKGYRVVKQIRYI